MPGKAIKTGRKRALSEVSDSKKTKLAEGALDRLPRAKSQQKKSRTASKPLAPKTDEERELESLLFGGDGDEKIAQTILSNAGRELDMAGLSRQKPSSTKVDTVGQDGTHDGHSDEYEEGDDVLFFEDTGEVPKNTDAGDGSADIVSSANAIAKSTSNKTADTTRAAWHDKDDRKVKISLMGNNRTRKLRHIEGEDMMAGDQYERRLREQ
ncbi:U3 snoRNP protein [Spiromyces aspiralis]|uniref:U3 snoRNP protein n=1 Tax=Spiromyces aspiralis TaxID=68401 RepID=A0ACC1H8I8_9FUNG|nr:U3 snoRNP protein [Spiromyces aspiralis]